MGETFPPLPTSTLATTTADMAVSQEKISVHSLADLKNTSDDAIPAYLNSLSFKQSHTLTDTRLALGYSAFLICAATLLGLQARLRQHKILHRGRSRHLHTTKRRPHILDLGRRERHHLYRHQFRWRQDPDSVENGETCTNLQFDGYGMEEGREGREGREHQEAFYAVVR